MGNKLYNLDLFLEESSYINYKSKIVSDKAKELFADKTDDIQKAKAVFNFVLSVPHSFDINADKIAVTASDVLEYNTGICYAKANLFAALLRSCGIPTGFCYQYITVANDDSMGWCIHCLNTVWLDGKWIKLDARGNTNGINARFSLAEPHLAFDIRPKFGEYAVKGIFAEPEPLTMDILKRSQTINDVRGGLPDRVTIKPLIEEI